MGWRPPHGGIEADAFVNTIPISPAWIAWSA
jgi:hypothetical protein